LAIHTETYYRKYGPMVLRRCRQLLRDEQQAQDAMHDVFVKLLVNEARLEDRAPSSLLFRIATNICLNKIRSSRRRPESRDDDLIYRIATAEEPGARSEARSLLARLFQREQESTRTIAVLHLLDGMTLQEVADEVGMSVSGVRKRLRKLRAQLGELEELAA
jgi:RNA polymerase sigma-70 factor (ECF subfamily)